MSIDDDVVAALDDVVAALIGEFCSSKSIISGPSVPPIKGGADELFVYSLYYCGLGSRLCDCYSPVTITTTHTNCILYFWLKLTSSLTRKKIRN
mmetsp:Transcript_25723/g.29718  ORF Transcript_25723/g.29718 Transcript_25723/m.29718 type:complete len:94 (-) Transcript_25723:22-303(-)